MRIAALLAAVALTGCATNAKFQEDWNSMIGNHEIHVLSYYGPPQSSYTLADGSKVLTYTRSAQMVMPGATTYQPVTTNTRGNVTLNRGIQPMATGTYTQQSTTYVQQQAPSTVIPLNCTVHVTIDAKAIVRSWQAQGNHCVAK